MTGYGGGNSGGGGYGGGGGSYGGMSMSTEDYTLLLTCRQGGYGGSGGGYQQGGYGGGGYNQGGKCSNTDVYIVIDVSTRLRWWWLRSRRLLKRLEILRCHSSFHPVLRRFYALYTVLIRGVSVMIG